MASGLTNAEVVKIIYGFIGVDGGYLRGFSYNSLREFYPMYCDLDINPDEINSTTRGRFMAILKRSNPATQAKILRGLLIRFPATDDMSEAKREEYEWIEGLGARLESQGEPIPFDATVTSDMVRAAIEEAELLIREKGAASGVDRIHTALHGYLMELCRRFQLTYSDRPTLNQLLHALIQHHPALKKGPRADDIVKILRSMSATLDVLNPIRNMASPAHPSERLAEPEAMLVVNAARTVLNYVDARLSGRAVRGDDVSF